MRSKLISSRWKLMMFISSIFLTLNTVVFGVPLSMSYTNQDIITENFAQEKERDDKKLYESNCIVNGSKYVEGDNVPGAGPCEECICHPPNVVCSMMKCPINSGCITIQLPNKCCPKYKCDCEHKGKLYNNGEKINKSDESACKVCFCNGGEIVCTSIVCYTRKDCQGYYLPGDCCPKFDNCSSTSTSIEQKSRNIHYFSTEPNYNEDSIWKRDTEKSLNQELSTVPNFITMPSIFFDSEENVTGQINTLVPNFEELDGSTSNSTSENTTTYEPDNVETKIPIGDLIIEDSSTSFLGFETDNLTIGYDKTTDSSLMVNNGTSEMTPQFEELFDTITDIDNSVVIAHQNGTETVMDITEAPAIEENINSSTETTTSTQVEIFDPSDLMLDTKRPMIEFSTITSELDGTTEMDYDGSREATTPRAPDKSTIGIPHKLIVDGSRTTIEDEINTEKTFTDLEDTTDMFGPNFGHRSYKTQANHILINTDTTDLKIKENNVTTFLPNTKYIKETITKSSQTELFDQPLNNSDIKNVDNSTLVNIKLLNQENILVEAPQVYNNTNSIELETTNITTCVNKSCSDYTELNDELLDFQKESTTTTPFIIETKVLPNEASPLFKKILYPKEYPDEFETIQNGPSLTITKRTYTSIPDIVYTTTTMVTLPTLDLIYKADKEIEKYFSEMQSTTVKSKNSFLSPLRNVSSLNST